MLVSRRPSVWPAGRPSGCLSIRGQNGVCSVSSTALIRSISYLHIFSSNFRRCIAYKVCFKIKKLSILSNSLKKFNFDFVFFCLRFQHDSIVWVIMRRRWYPQNAVVQVVLVIPVTRQGRDAIQMTRTYFCTVYQVGLGANPFLIF